MLFLMNLDYWNQVREDPSVKIPEVQQTAHRTVHKPLLKQVDLWQSYENGDVARGLPKL
jgi:hypothetical protein